MMISRVQVLASNSNDGNHIPNSSSSSSTTVPLLGDVNEASDRDLDGDSNDDFWSTNNGHGLQRHAVVPVPGTDGTGSINDEAIRLVVVPTDSDEGAAVGAETTTTTNAGNYHPIEAEQQQQQQRHGHGHGHGHGQNNNRFGTISSARYNLLSTMVGGGCLSLPLAFEKSGNAFIGPLLLIATAAITEFVFRIHIQSSRIYNKHSTTTSSSSSNDSSNDSNDSNNNPNPNTQKGIDSFEKIAGAAFGNVGVTFCKILITLMCFFGTVGYAVLLRDMLKPINDTILSIDTTTAATTHTGTENVLHWNDNICMWIVILFVTPACTLQTLTPLEKFGALGMFAVLVVGCCIFYRSSQCMIEHSSSKNMLSYFHLLPEHWKDVLDVLPLYISCYVCHYNLLPVHNELHNPTPERVRHWLQSTVWGSTAFYCILGLAGSAYGNCVGSKQVHGNILLDFPENDPLLFVGRMCLAVTISLAFPMLTIPSRDILLQSIPQSMVDMFSFDYERILPNIRVDTRPTTMMANATLTEALLQDRETLDATDQDYVSDGTIPMNDTNQEFLTQIVNSEQQQQQQQQQHDQHDQLENRGNNENHDESAFITSSSSSSFSARLGASIVMLWSASIVASFVTSIDIVWDLLGSSLSILLSFLIPCGSYVVLCRIQQQSLPNHESVQNIKQWVSVVLSILLVAIFTPLMFISTINAVYNTFFSKP